MKNQQTIYSLMLSFKTGPGLPSDPPLLQHLYLNVIKKKKKMQKHILIYESIFRN